MLEELDQQGLDYHIGMVTTDVHDPARSGRLVEIAGERWVSPTPDAEAVLQQLLSVDVVSSVTQGLGAAFLALEVLGDSDNEGFLRSEASLAVAVFSHTDVQTSAPLLTPGEFVDWLVGFKPDRQRPRCTQRWASRATPTP